MIKCECPTMCVSNKHFAYSEKIMSETFLLIIGIPEPPQMLEFTERTSQTISLTWAEPHDNNAPIDSYLVMYTQPEFVSGDRNKNVSTIVETANITGLFPGVTYTFTVIAINEIGRSHPSEPLSVKTLDEGENSIKSCRLQSSL